MSTTAIIILALVVVVAVERFLAFRKLLASVQYRPGFRTLLSVNGASSFFPRIPFISVGNSAFIDKYTSFEKFDSDIFNALSLWPLEANFILADPQAVKEVVGSRARFPKPIELYDALLIYGTNIVASEHEAWKRFRRISNPAFTEPNNRLVWDETVKIMNDLFNNVWGNQKQVVTDNALHITMPIALFVIGAAGFGRRLAWNDEMAPPAGHRITFKAGDALYTVSESIPTRMLAPRWATYFLPHVKKVFEAFDELGVYMQEMVTSRRNAEVKEERYDLLSSLLDASEGDAQLTDAELIGNIFVFLVAGHETTAHTLCFALGLLALYPDEQERLYQEVIKAVPKDRDPIFQDMASLDYVICVLSETLRIFPPVIGIPKFAAEDCTLTTTNNNGDKVTLAIPKGSGINIDTVGLHNNPKYWDEPEAFKPSRFMGDWPRDAFLPFSGGVRSCIGRRFAELESVVVMAMLVKKYKITVKDEPQFAHETFEEKKARVLKTKNGLTLTPAKTSLVFTLRE
ncbi:cytochrome P450 [Cristinia sonorae]|uniref:Cytochrome P450 n=1 Tax=Cristinia sonorae TaxID=1940300 RepID=A0A8K0UDP0_9AGAR|nr:cytochrome P450 [Cristinia sonorae]